MANTKIIERLKKVENTVNKAIDLYKSGSQIKEIHLKLILSYLSLAQASAQELVDIINEL